MNRSTRGRKRCDDVDMKERIGFLMVLILSSKAQTTTIILVSGEI